MIDPANPFVLEPHLRCAARELPLADEDVAYFGPGPPRPSSGWWTRASSRGGATAWHDAGRESPHRLVDVRRRARRTFTIVIAATRAS